MFAVQDMVIVRIKSMMLICWVVVVPFNWLKVRNNFSSLVQCLRFLTNETGVQYAADYIRFLWPIRGTEKSSDFEPLYDKSAQS